jgi:hypothetical protein
MATFFKLALTALVLNACFQAGRSALAFYQFEDSVQQAVLFSAKETPPQVKARIVELAVEQQVPLDPDVVEVKFSGTQARVTGEYTDAVRLVPGAFVYDWTHVLDLDVRRMPY